MRLKAIFLATFLIMTLFGLNLINVNVALAANIGETCSSDGQCTPDPSSCVNSRCACDPGYERGVNATVCRPIGSTSTGGGGTTGGGTPGNNVGWGNVSTETIGNLTGLGVKDPREIAANVINIILGFLGIIAVVLILIGGFMWMTAAGNDDKVATAKKIMTAGIIGLVIVLAAFGIAKFVVNALITATA